MTVGLTGALFVACTRKPGLLGRRQGRDQALALALAVRATR